MLKPLNDSTANSKTGIDIPALNMDKQTLMQTSSTTIEKSSRAFPRFWWWVVGITVVAAALRLYKLDQWSFWIDEIFAVQWSIDVYGGEFGKGEVGPRPLAFLPTLFGMLAGGIDVGRIDLYAYETWQSLGINEWIVRFPSALIGIITIPLLGIASRRFIGTPAAIVLMMLLALSTWHVWMSQTARFYIHQFLFYNLALIFYYTGSDKQKPNYRDLILASVFFCCAILSQLTSGLLLGIFLLDVLWQYMRNRSMKVPLIALGVISAGLLVAGAFFLFDYMDQLAHGKDTYGNFKGSKQRPSDLILGLPYMVGAVTVVAAALGLVRSWLINRRLSTYLCSAAIVPLATFVVLGVLKQDVHIRYVFVALYAWLALAAVGLAEMVIVLQQRSFKWTGWTPVALVLIAMMLSNYIYYTGGNGYRAHWREAFNYVETHRKPGEIITAEANESYQGRYYTQHSQFKVINSSWTREQLLAMDRPTWIVLRVSSATQTDRFTWISEVAQLQRVFNTRIFQPSSFVHVYYYNPQIATVLQQRDALPQATVAEEEKAQQ